MGSGVLGMDWLGGGARMMVCFGTAWLIPRTMDDVFMATYAVITQGADVCSLGIIIRFVSVI